MLLVTNLWQVQEISCTPKMFRHSGNHGAAYTMGTRGSLPRGKVAMV